MPSEREAVSAANIASTGLGIPPDAPPDGSLAVPLVVPLAVPLVVPAAIRVNVSTTLWTDRTFG